jgi:spermidine synthase
MDEHSYQEMIAFLPLNAHPKPSKVLIIGGGDGGVARECLKHPLVDELVQCEIDKRVIELSKQYFPSMAKSYENPKLKLVVGDGYKYLSELEDESFDVIITDSSDPKGPAECLFKQPYYELLYKKLTKDGIICCQAESIWFDLDFIEELLEMNRKIFKKVAYASTMTCTYPSGQIGFLICSKDPEAKLNKPIHLLDEDKLELRYYSKEIHEAAFVLPRFVRTKLYRSLQEHNPFK